MKKKFLSALLALTLLVSMQPVQAFAEQIILTDPAVKDIFLNVDSDAGYSTTDLAAAVESEIANLGGTTPPEYRINTNNTQIDTTNLSNWYVYDHYDTAYWAARAATLSAAGQIASNDSSLAWKKDFSMNSLVDPKRPYTGQTYTEQMGGSIYRIEDYISQNLYLGSVQKFDQHIFSGTEDSGAFMTFAGYGSPANMDYLFYPDTLSGTKTVTYTINSTDVNTHSLHSAGFLCNTGIDASGYIKGYILVYAYSDSINYTLDLYPIKSGTKAQDLAGGNSIFTYCDAAKTASITGTLTRLTVTDVTLTITPDSVKVSQKAPGATDYTTMKEWNGLTSTGYNGFGPYVKYSGHGCGSTSAYKFSNLKMSSSTNAGGSVSAFSSLRNADYIEDPAVEKYLVNILGTNSAYDLTRDANYLALVQQGNIKLFTNKDVSSISSYLPESYVDTTNNTLSTLATSIAKYILGIETGTNVETPSTPTVSTIVANFSLTSGGIQVNHIKRDIIPAEGVMIEVINNTIFPDGSPAATPTYTLVNPAGEETRTSAPFTVTNSSTNWPTGEYKLTMDYGEGSIPSTVKFSVLEDLVAPAVSAVKNGNVVDLTFSNTPGGGNYPFVSQLYSYVIETTATTTTPTSTWENEINIINNATSASVAITQAGYMHILVKDEAGNIGHTYLQIVQVFPTITAPIASSIDFGQPLSDAALSQGTAMYNGSAVAGTFTWTNSTLKPVAGAGNKYSVTFTPNSAFYATSTIDVTVSVNKVTPVVTLTDKTTSYTGSQISIAPATVAGVSGVAAPTGAVTYTYYTDTSCTTLTTPGNSGAASNGGAPVIAGKYYVKATVAADSNYNAVTTAAPGTLIISPTNPLDLSITGVPGTITYGDPSFTLNSTGGSGNGVVTFTSSNPQVASVTQSGYVTIHQVGSADITATKASDGNYQSQTATTELFVNPKNVTYTIKNSNRTYTGLAQYADITASVLNFKAGSDYTVVYKQGTTVIAEPKEKGSYEITVSTINGNYTGSGTGTLTISSSSQSELQITGLPGSEIQYQDGFELTANSGSGTGTIAWSSSNTSVATVSNTGAVEITGIGPVTITATKAADSNFDVQIAAVQFTANKKTVNITATATDRDYMPGNKNVSVTLLTNIEGLTATCTSATMIDANAGLDKTVTINGLTVSDVKFRAASATIHTTVTINPIDDSLMTISGVPSSITYEDSDFRLSASSNGRGDVVWSSDCTDVARVHVSSGVVTIMGTGTAVITGTKDSDGNYNSQSASVTLEVNAKEVVYTITGNSQPYTGQPQSATVVPSEASFVEGVDYTVTYEQDGTVVDEPTQAGAYDIVVSTLNENYTGSSTTATLTIQIVDQNYDLQIGGLPAYVEYENQFALYANGGSGTGGISWEVAEGNEFATIDENGLVRTTGVGEVTIILTKAADINHTVQTRSETFRVNKKDISISFFNTAKTYNGDVQNVSVNGTATSKNTLEDILDLSYTFQSTGELVNFRNAETYNVDATINEGFEGLYVLRGNTSAVATMEKAVLVITAENKTKIYGDDLPEYTLDYTLEGTDTDENFNFPEISCEAAQTSSVGVYDIILAYTGDHGNLNYDITLVNGKLTIEKAPLTVTAEDKNIYYGEAVPTCTVRYKGFVQEEGPEALNGALAFECEYMKGNDIGSYTITPSGLISGNYEISFIEGTLIVSPLPVAMTVKGTTVRITVTLTPGVAGLTLANFTISQGKEQITPTAIVEYPGGSKYYITVPMTDGEEYTLHADNGMNYEFDVMNFTATAVLSGGGGSVSEPPATQPTVDPALRFNIGVLEAYQISEAGLETVLPMDAAPILSEDRTLLPIRFVVEPLGGTVVWNAAEKKVTITRGTTTIELWIGNNIAKVNGVEKMIDPDNANVKPLIVKPGRTMLPLRFISETLGCKVEWNQLKQEVTIRY